MSDDNATQQIKDLSEVTTLPEEKLTELIKAELLDEDTQDETPEQKPATPPADTTQQTPPTNDTQQHNDIDPAIAEKFKDKPVDELLKELSRVNHLAESKKKQVNDRGQYIDQLKAEIAKLTDQQKLLTQNTKTIEDTYAKKKEDVIDNPVKLAETTLDERQEKARNAQRVEEVNRQLIRANNKVFLQSNLPDIEELIPDMVAVIKRDHGNIVNEQSIREFQADIYSEDPALTLMLALKAKEMRHQKETEELKKKPDEVLKKIANASNGTRNINFTGNSNRQSGNISPEAITKMTDKELEALIASGGDEQ